MNDSSSPGGLPFGVQIHELVIATALAIGAGFAVEFVPESARFSIAVSFLGLVALYLLIALRRIYRLVNETNRATRVLDYRSDADTGILKKGDVRNVSLRVETIILLLDGLMSNHNAEQQRTLLEAAGYQSGKAWGKEFTKLCRNDLKIDGAPLKEKCREWAVYDATAGMGRFEFNLSEKGAGSVTLKNGFLSDIDTKCELDHFFAGYLKGALEEIVGYPVTVELQEASKKAHVDAEFDVDVHPPHSKPK